MNPEMLTLDIRQRERELHEMQDLRISQLESEITKRDNLLIEVSKRYSQLQEDFKYNLGLITARDLEINRLDEIVKARTTDFESADNENRSLHIKIDTMESKYTEREKAWEQERLANKELLREVKGLCDQMQYKHDEDIRTLNREIEYLRAESLRAAVSRDESLESQRKDLIETYEGIMEHNETAHQKKVEEISGQIQKLDKRIEQMQTESLKLKSDLAESHRHVEKLNAEVAAAEEARRQLKWQLDDERSSKTVADDGLQRQLLSVQLELSTTREALNKEIEELKKTNDKMVLDNQREKEYRLAVEKRLEEAKVVFQHDKQLLLVEINEYRVHETMLQNEIATLREERDSSLNRGASLRLELESLDLRLKNLLKERDLLRGELSAEKVRVSEGETKLVRLSQEFQQYREETREKEYKAMQSAADQILDHKNTAYEEVRTLKEMHEGELKRLQQRQTEEMQQTTREWSEKFEELQTRYQSRSSEVNRLQESLEEAQRSSAAVQMRLDIKEESITRLNKEVQALEAKQQSYLRSLQMHSQQQHLGGQLDMSHLDLNQSFDASLGGAGTGGGMQLPLSPAFSTDLGAIPSISFPNSPMPSYAGGMNGNGNRFRMLDGQTGGSGAGGGGGRLTVQQVLASTQYIDLQAKYDQCVIDLDQAVLARDNLTGENEKLKNNIKEMRDILTHLQSDSELQQKQNEGKLAEKDLQLASMETQIDKMVDECNRLRGEGKRLMDTCNELRAANHQLTRQLQGGANISGSSSLPMASTPLRPSSSPAAAAAAALSSSGYSNVFDYVTSSPSVLGTSVMSPYHRPAAIAQDPYAASHHVSHYAGGLPQQAGLTINTTAHAALQQGLAPPVSPSRVSVPKDHLSAVDQYHRVWGNLSYHSKAAASSSSAGPHSPSRPVVAHVGSSSNGRGHLASRDQDEFSVPSHYSEAMGFMDHNSSGASAPALPPAVVASDTDDLDSLDLQATKKSVAANSKLVSRRHTVASVAPPAPPSVSGSAASKLFRKESEDVSEPDADLVPVSGSNSGAIGAASSLNLTGHSIRSASFTSATSGGSSSGSAVNTGASGTPQSYVNRGVSVFHKSGLPVPISNSDRETSSQSRALSSLKNKAASSAAPKGVRRNSTMSSVPHVRNYALGEEGDPVA